jgi:hypothetical protein
MRLDIFMDYQPQSEKGTASVQWIPLASDDMRLRPILIELLYARILSIHAETRSQLFWTIDELSKQNVRDEGITGFDFKEWKLSLGLGIPPQTIWPWDIIDNPSQLINPKVYRATLKALRPHVWDIHLEMAWGLERILTPASLLIAMHSYSKSTDQESRYELAMFLWQINEFYKSPEQIKPFKEATALRTAMDSIRAGGLRCPRMHGLIFLFRGRQAMPLSNELYTLHRYYIWANRMRTLFDTALSKFVREEGQIDEDAKMTKFLAGDPGLFMSYWYSSLYVVVEGYRKLDVHDKVIDSLISSPNTELLRRYRNGAFHFQRRYYSDRLEGFISEQSSASWVRDLNREFGRFFLQRIAAANA